MAEKRKLPPRRESSVKRRASEAPQPQPPKRHVSTPASRATPRPERVRRPLPTKIKDGEALPTVPSAQPTSLSSKEYQSIAESAVLLASLERSKKKWLSDGILERYWTKPKKTKREQIEGRNPPKESMTKVGACNIVVGPHIFDAMLYTVKDPNAPPSIQYASPQRPMMHYGHPSNFQPYQPYSNTPHQPWQPSYSHAHPSPGYPSGQPHPKPPSHSHPPPQNDQRPSPSQNSSNPPNPQTPQPAKPSPDPVIQMLATRAASDPELKSLMRVVASSKATQEQLRTFQTHIDELNAIIKSKEQQPQRQQAQTPGSAQAPAPQASPESQKPAGQASPAQLQTQQKPPQKPQVEVQIPSQSASAPSGTSTPKANGTPQVKQEPDAAPPAATPAEPMRASVSSSGATPGPGPTPGSQSNSKQPSPAMRPPQQQHAPGIRPAPSPYQAPPPSIQSRPPQYGSPAQYYRAGPPPPTPKLSYRSVVFEFTSPLTPYGSSTSGHAGSGDRYLFPEYSILEWLPGGNTLIASFLVVKKVDPNTPFPIDTGPEANTSRSKGKGTTKSKKANPQSTPSQQPSTPTPTPTDQKPPAPTAETKEPATTPTQQQPPPPLLKEYYQPITFRIFSTSPRVLEPLTRVVKPPDEVRRYMNEVMDRAERAPGGFLAFRLPREAEKPVAIDAEESANGSGSGHASTRRSGTPAGRTRLSRGRTAAAAAAAEEEDEDEDEGEEEEGGEDDDEREGEQSVGEDREEEGEDEEEELKAYYGSVTGLAPLAG